ncbi:tungstate transport system permease protein [Haloechinothrix alba]|uniref:Tungstate transport system permease protein n=1 Tax=Haloechinothrix alba TaxID=664784 RepID=A0A238YPL3_9PSEU|nr:ABC transporter permease [Haloechinothrix alba]SNR73077.1 tungstate transport system permease protein [Haloechinothrix alba]
MYDTVIEVLARSALVSVSATLVAALAGISLGTALALARVSDSRAVIALVNTGMALPTVVVGLVVAMLLWRSGPLGGLGLIYTIPGMVIAQALIVTPLVTGITMAALRQLPRSLPDQLRTLGANRLQMVLRLWLEARVALLAAAMAGFGLAISEVGAVTVVGGNIHGHTQVMTTAIVENVSRGEFGVAIIYGSILLGLAFLINGLLASVQRRAAAWERN